MNELSMKSDKKLPNLKEPVKGKKGTSKYMRMKVTNAPYASDYKKAMNAGFKSDANRKAAFAKMNDSTHSADKKPEKYVGPDGKTKIRMVAMDKEVVKKEEMQAYRIGHKSVAGNVHAKNPDDAMKQLRKKGVKGDIKLTHRGPVSSLPKRRIPTREELDKAKNEASVLKPKSAMDIVKHARTLAKNPRDYMMNRKKYIDKARAKVFKMYPKEAINHDDAHRDAQTHSDGSMSVKKIPSMIKKSGDKHLHLHMKSYHKEKDGQDFAKKHGYKVKNYVKTPSGTRMDIHKESVDEARVTSTAFRKKNAMVNPMDKKNISDMAKDKKYKGNTSGLMRDVKKKYPDQHHSKIVQDIYKKHAETNEMIDPMDLRGRPKKKDPNPESPYGMKHPLHPMNIAKKKAKEAEKVKKEAKTFDYFDSKDAASAHAKKHGGKVFVNTGKGATKVKGKPVNTHVVIKKEAVEYPHMMYDPKTGNQVKAKTPADHNKYSKMGYTHEKPNTDEALNLQQRMKRSRLMKRMKARIKIGRKRAMKKMANKKTIEKRAMRQARNQIAKKLTRGIPKGELSFARKQEIEKRLSKPALQSRIKRIAKRIFKDVRKKEVERKKG